MKTTHMRTTLDSNIHTTSEKDPLILLGVWNVLPVEVPGWYDVGAIEHFRKITGVKMRSFMYIENDLNHQCFFGHEMNQLCELFEKEKTEEEQIQYISHIYDDFYKEVSELETCLDESEKQDFSTYSNEQLAGTIQRLAELWTHITMQIWYALFLDIWYPLEDQQKAVKQIAAAARDHAGHLHERSNIIEREVYAKAAKRLSLDTQMISYLFPAEITDGLLNGTSYASEAAKRSKFCVIIGASDKLEIHSGTKARELFERYQPPSTGKTAQEKLSGVPASKGHAKGIVRVILRNKDFDTFEEGEVLVALQTMVHYLPIMKKASAILTEFGGLTSHAAIVSRELGKPCIVGIQNLLASLKNGDTVTVDAETGTVRLIM